MRLWEISELIAVKRSAEAPEDEVDFDEDRNQANAVWNGAR